MQSIIKGGTFILGSEVKSFEEEIKEFTGAKHAIGVASGTDTLGFKDGKKL